MELLVTAGRDGKDRGFTEGAYEYMQSSPGSANGFFIIEGAYKYMQSSPGSANGFFITEGAYEYMRRGFAEGAYVYMQSSPGPAWLLHR